MHARAPRPPWIMLSPDDGAPLAARAVVGFHLRGFARAEPAARTGEVEAVHQLRVATRKLGATLRLFEPILPAAFVERTRREVAWLADAIGQVRELDVLREQVTVRAASLPPELRSALGPLALAIHDQRAAAQAALIDSLDSIRCRRLLERLGTFAASGSAGRRPKPLAAAAPALVRPLLRAALRAGRQTDESSAPEALHRVRVRGKRLRYALETLGSLGGKSTTKMLRRLRRLQDVLGEHQDAASAIRWLMRHAETASAPPTTLLATGALIHGLTRRARKLRRRVPEVWQPLDRSRLTRSLLAELARPARRANHVTERLRATG